MKIYFVRHQAAGVVHQFPFSESPNKDQMDAVKAFCFQSFGPSHPKTPDEPYWVRVEERDVLTSEVPAVEARPEPSFSNAAGVGEFTVSGTGEIKDPV